MYKGSDIIKKPVVARNNGAVIDRVKDAIFDTRDQNLIALLIDEARFFGKPKIIPFSRIRAIGEDAITVDDASAIETADKQPRAAEILEHNYTVQGRKLM